MKRLNACFNMVEIALAMAVLALGVISIMALFPIGLSANRDSMAESYAADSADQFVHQIEDLIRRSGGWATYITGGVIPVAKPVTADFAISAASAVPGSNRTLYTGSAPGIFKAIRYVDMPGGTADQYDASVDILDFEAIIVVWRSPSAVFDRTGDGFTNDDDITGDGVWNTDDETKSYSIAVQLNVEISWPARLPYAQRQKSFFKKELFAR